MSNIIKADVVENRLYFKLSGDFAKEEIDKQYSDITFLVADLAPTTENEEGSNAATANPKASKLKNYLITNGLGEVVRVINGNSLLVEQSKYLSSGSSGVIPVYAKLSAEARDHLVGPKRNGIRFYVNKIPISYLTPKTCGTGRLVNISTGGCSVESITTPLKPGEELVMRITFVNQDLSIEEFQVKARVIGGDHDSFAAKFLELTDDQKHQLWKCLIRGSLDGGE